MASRTSVSIPATLEDAVAELTGLGALLTAKEWSRAAIVNAYTRAGSVGGDTTIRKSADAPMAFTAFAKLGITGLKSENTVARYHRAWAEHGTGPALPGKAVTLPTLDWPQDAKLNELGPQRRAALEGLPGASKVADILNNPNAVRDAILHDPKLAAAATEAVIERSENDGQVRLRLHDAERKWVAERQKHTAAREERERETFDVFYDAMSALSRARNNLKHANGYLLEMPAGSDDRAGLLGLIVQEISEELDSIKARMAPTAPDFVGDVEEWLREHTPTSGQDG